MTDRYSGRPRPRSPTLYNPGRTSLPINISGWANPPSYEHHDHHHVHAVPTSRREITSPRSSTSSVSNAGTVTTTYKITADPPSRASSTRDGSRTRRSTLDNNSRPSVVPTIVTASPRHRPVVHSGGRPASPMKNPYRSSEEDYYAVPASSNHHYKRYSATMDNADMSRLAREREGSRLHLKPGREGAVYTTRSRPVYPTSLVRHPDTVADDYGDNGYGYTNPRELVQYDLNNSNAPTRHHSRRDSFEGGRAAKPSSITGYNDLPRSYDPRERGPPPSTRGFDRIPPQAPTWDQPQIRMPVAPGPPPMDPIQRPAPFDPVEPPRRSDSRTRRPVSMYHDNRESKRLGRDDYYEVRDDEPRRQHRHERYDDAVEQRGFGIRADNPERPERPERVERSDRPSRSERSGRDEYLDDDRSDRKGHTDHKGRDALATGLSLAGVASGINTVKNSTRDDRDDRDERDDRRRRDYDEEPRRRRETRDERESVDLGGRDPKARRRRDDDRDTPTTPRDVQPPRDIPPRDARDIPPPPRDVPPPRDSRDMPPPPPRDIPQQSNLAPDATFVDLSKRDPRERQSSRAERDSDPERRERRRHPSDVNGSAIDSRSDTEESGDAAPRSRRESRVRRESGALQAGFNPKDPMDLKALKAALSSKDTAPPRPPKEPIQVRTPRQSTAKEPREAAEIRNDLNSDRRSREPLANNENGQLRVVSPPREKPEEKTVKGILRPPRDKFPEDPAPIREGVAPLKDAKKDGVPPDARWTKISRKLVNPEALEAGKERYEAREDFVIVLRVLSRDEVQGYAEVTQRIRAAREEMEEMDREERRRARRERHERHKRERSGEIPRSERSERRHQERRHRRERERGSSNSESDTTDDDVYEAPKMLEAPKKRAAFEEALMSGGLGETSAVASGPGSLRENPDVPGQYLNYTRTPPVPTSVASQVGSSRRDER